MVDVRLADRPGGSVLPRGQAHVGPGGVGPLANDLGGGMPVGRPVHLVLHGLEEQLGQLGLRVVVDAGGVDVGDLLVEQPFAGADVADAGEQFVEVVGPERASALIRSSSSVKPLTRSSLSRAVAHWRNSVPRGERTR